MPVVDCNGADLYYEDHGTGQPIVFLHGMGGCTSFPYSVDPGVGEYR